MNPEDLIGRTLFVFVLLGGKYLAELEDEEQYKHKDLCGAIRLSDASSEMCTGRAVGVRKGSRGLYRLVTITTLTSELPILSIYVWRSERH